MKRAAIESQLGATQEALALAEAEIARLRAALAWYADHSNYDGFEAPGVLDSQQGTWHPDGGERARAAIDKARER